MKLIKMNKLITSSLIATVYATDFFEGQTTINILDDSKAVVVLLHDEDDNSIWTIETSSFFEQDTGYRWLRIEHTLYANIHADDTVTFDLTFSSDYDPWVDPLAIIEDSGRCSVAMNSDDNRFWTTTVTDYFWKCSLVSCSNADLSTTVWRTGDYTE